MQHSSCVILIVTYLEGRCSKERCSFKLKIHSMSRVWLWSQEKVLKVT